MHATNLALADMRVLAEVLERAVRSKQDDALEEYRPRVLSRVWKAQRFSYWRTTMLHALHGTADFDLRRQLGELESVTGSVPGRHISPRPTPAGLATSKTSP
jgi:p-hydroxybenzoate 3-monooxygenase